MDGLSERSRQRGWARIEREQGWVSVETSEERRLLQHGGILQRMVTTNEGNFELVWYTFKGLFVMKLEQIEHRNRRPSCQTKDSKCTLTVGVLRRH